MYWSRHNPRRTHEPWLNGYRVRLALEADDIAGYVSRLATEHGQIISEAGRAKTIIEWGKVEIRPIQA